MKECNEISGHAGQGRIRRTIEGNGVQEHHIGVWYTWAHLLTVMTSPSVCSLLSSLIETFWTFFAGLFSFHSEMTFFLASKTDDTPFSQQWFFSLLSQCILCNHVLTLIPFCLTWLLVVHVYLWHYILSSLGTRTVSYLYWYFLKCLACSRCLLNMWLRVKFHVLSPEMYKESLMFFLLTAINQSSIEKKMTSPPRTHILFCWSSWLCRQKSGSIHDVSYDGGNWC